MTRIGLRQLGWRKVLLAIGLIVGLSVSGLPATAGASVDESKYNDEVLPIRNCSYSPHGNFLTLHRSYYDEPEFEGFTSGDLYLFGHRISMENAGWQTDNGREISSTKASFHGTNTQWFWGVAVDLDFLLDPPSPVDYSHTIRESSNSKYAMAEGTIIIEHDDGLAQVIPNCRVNYFESPHTSRIEYPVAVPAEASHHAKDQFVSWCITWVGGKPNLVLNEGRVDDGFKPPAEGTITFDGGVEYVNGKEEQREDIVLQFDDANPDDEGRWLIPMPGYETEMLRKPAFVEIDKSRYIVFTTCRTPIAIDLDGSGQIEVERRDVDIDIDADGQLDRLNEWFGPTDGILVDLSEAGPVSGAHLFGDEGAKYESGYEKLAELDADADGTVSGSELQNIGLWFDTDGDAQMDLGEVESAIDYGVSSLSVEHENFVSTAELADGSVVATEDVWLQVDPSPGQPGDARASNWFNRSIARQ